QWSSQPSAVAAGYRPYVLDFRWYRCHFLIDRAFLSDGLLGALSGNSTGAGQPGRSRPDIWCYQLDGLADDHLATNSAGHESRVYADLRVEPVRFWHPSAHWSARTLHNIDDAGISRTLFFILHKPATRSVRHFHGVDGGSVGGDSG